MRGKSSPILVAVAFIVFVDMLGIGLILPVMPRLIGEIAQMINHIHRPTPRFFYWEQADCLPTNLSRQIRAR